MKAGWVILLSFQAIIAAGAESVDVPVVTTPIPHPSTMLLRSPIVRQELGIRPEQVEAIAKAVDEVELPLWQSRVLAPGDIETTAKPLLEKLDETLSMALTGKQAKRLDQLELQALGLVGLLNESTAARLRLTRSQRDALKGRVLALQRGGRDTWSVRSILTASQGLTLRSMMGTPFDLSRVRQRACRAPELRGVEAWINSDPLTLAQLRGKVVVIHFYTFGCINCIRNLPHYNNWYEDFPSDRLTIVGIHRPETPGERVVADVRRKAVEAGAQYPIAIDNESQNWEAWANRAWPSVYLVDKDGFIRYWWYGELDWKGARGHRLMHAKIQELLKEG